MKRLRVILLFLLLGAVVNVAVAWGIAICVNSPSSLQTSSMFQHMELTSNTRPCWWLYSEDNFGSTFLYGLAILEGEMSNASKDTYSNFDMSKVPAWSQFAVPPAIRFWGSEISKGWPLRTLFWINTTSSKTATNKHVWIVREHPNAIYLPLAPIWSGLFLNTLFYAAILWLLITGPFALRRITRHKRGLCVTCAYDLRGAEHEACPECGLEVPIQ